MNVRAFILCSAAFLAAPVFARDKTDVLVMKNGDHLTGEIKELDGGALYVSMDYIIRHKLGPMVESGPPREQTVIPGEDGRRLRVHRHALHR
jgi:hypothetical protein